VLFYSAFGYIHGRRADWKTARDFYIKSVEFAPADELSYYCLAPLLAQLDDIERLRHYREQMIKQFGTTSNSSTARHMAKGSLILPAAFEEFKTINKWVDMSVAAEPESAEIQILKALAEYRQGNFTDAMGWLRKITPPNVGNNWSRTVQFQMLLAMTQYHLKQFDAARATLATGLHSAERMDRAGKDDLFEWPDWVIASQLMQQASALIETDTKKTAVTK